MKEINEQDLEFCEHYQNVLQMVEILDICSDVLTDKGERELKLHKQYLVDNLDEYLTRIGRMES